MHASANLIVSLAMWLLLLCVWGGGDGRDECKCMRVCVHASNVFLMLLCDGEAISKQVTISK